MGWAELDSLERSAEVMLAGETWRDLFERRRRVDDLRGQDRRPAPLDRSRRWSWRTSTYEGSSWTRFARSASPEAVRAAWEETTATTVLDPTCGSGAFLFAALDVLDEVYAAILETAELHVRSGARTRRRSARAHDDAAKGGQNVAYFRLKHASLSNLFGLDIMEEAVEIAKLRLFLTLAARLERAGGDRAAA